MLPIAMLCSLFTGFVIGLLVERRNSAKLQAVIDHWNQVGTIAKPGPVVPSVPPVVSSPK